MAKRALITTITGREGAYVTEFLLAKGDAVHGLLRRASLFNTDRIDHLYRDPHLAGMNSSVHCGELTDATALRRVFETVQPDAVYNLAAQSHVKVSFEVPEYTADGGHGHSACSRRVYSRIRAARTKRRRRGAEHLGRSCVIVTHRRTALRP
jgi:GDP-mannose 4,6-dehydratase